MKKDRLSEIKEVIRKYGKITYETLSELFPDVSNMTIRRDLVQLEKEGAILRVRNGAISVDEISKKAETQFVHRLDYKVDEKKEIAKKTIDLIDTSNCIFIDSGSTTLHLAKELPDDDYYIITNALNVATEILRKSKPTVSILGGDVSRNNLVTIGKTTREFLNNLYIETAIMTTTAFSLESGFTCGFEPEAEIKSAVIAKAKKVVILLDSSKIGKSMPYRFADLADVDYIITDSNFPADTAEKLKTLGIEVL